MNLGNVVHVTRKRRAQEAGAANLSVTGNWIQATGYIIATDLVLTARHAICSRDENAAKFKDVLVRQFSENERREDQYDYFATRCIWTDNNLDIAVLQLSGGQFDQAKIFPVEFGELGKNEIITCKSICLPEARMHDNVRDSHLISGRTEPLHGARGRLNTLIVPDTAWENPLLWQGASGAALFSADQPMRLIGVICSTPQMMKAKMLNFAPIHSLINAADLKQHNFTKNHKPLDNSSENDNAITKIDRHSLSNQLYLADYKPQILKIKTNLKASKGKKEFRPLIFSVTGVPEDEFSSFANLLRKDLLHDTLPERPGVFESNNDSSEEVILPIYLNSKSTPVRNIEDLKRQFLLAFNVHQLDIEGQDFTTSFNIIATGERVARVFYSPVFKSQYCEHQENLLRLWIEEWQRLSYETFTEQFVYFLMIEKDSPALSVWGKIRSIYKSDKNKTRIKELRDNFLPELDDLHCDLGEFDKIQWLPEISDWVQGEKIRVELGWDEKDVEAASTLVFEAIDTQLNEPIRLMNIRDRILKFKNGKGNQTNVD